MFLKLFSPKKQTFSWQTAFARKIAGVSVIGHVMLQKTIWDISGIRNELSLSGGWLYFWRCTIFAEIMTTKTSQYPFPIVGVCEKLCTPSDTPRSPVTPSQRPLERWYFSRLILRNKGTIKLWITLIIVTYSFCYRWLENYPGWHASPAILLLTVAQLGQFKTTLWRGSFETFIQKTRNVLRHVSRWHFLMCLSWHEKNYGARDVRRQFPLGEPCCIDSWMLECRLTLPFCREPSLPRDFIWWCEVYDHCIISLPRGYGHRHETLTNVARWFLMFSYFILLFHVLMFCQLFAVLWSD